MLKQALENPKLDKKSSAYLVIRRDLGELYARSLNQVDKAADSFAAVIDGLDDKAAAKFSPAQTRMILGDQPENSYELFGDTFFLARRYDLAVRAYRRGLAYDPDDTELPLRLTEALLRGGQKAEALATLEPLLKDKPEGREPYELLGQVLTSLERKAEVIPRLEAALKDDAKNVGLKYVLADRYKEAGRVAEANKLYEGLVQGQPDPHGFAALAQSLRKEKKYDDLLKLFERALTVPQGADSIKPQMEAICIDKEAVTAVLDAGLRMMGEEPPALNPIGQNILVYMANRADQPDKIIALERLALKRNPSPTGYRELWMALYRGNRFEEAVEAMEEMLQKYPGEADGRNYTILSQTRFRAGKFEGALEAAEQALKLNPNDPDAISLAALVLSKMNRFEESIARYQSMIERFGNNDEILKQARSGLSATYVDMGDLDKGQAELEILYQKMPGDAGINNDLGYLYADRGQKLEEAEAMIRKAVEEEPDNGSFLDSLGWVLYRRGKVHEALEPLEKAAKVQASDATIFDHLGDVLFRLQQPAKAREAWEKAEALMSKTTPPDKKLPDVRRKLDALKQQAPGNDRGNP
ncbi:MAG: tetratricopeptide repeat protein [Isosphaeraceae bacterium]